MVEVEGRIHKNRDVRENDIRRTIELEDMGVRVIRFTNEEVIGQMEEVLRKISLVAAGYNLPPPPSPEGKGDVRRNSGWITGQGFLTRC